MTTTIIAIIFVGFFFFALSIRMIFLKNGEFRGTCASQNPLLNLLHKKKWVGNHKFLHGDLS